MRSKNQTHGYKIEYFILTKMYIFLNISQCQTNFEIFFRIMSQFDQLNENDVDYEAENVYSEIRNMPQKEATMDIKYIVHTLQKTQHGHIKPSRLQGDVVSLSDNVIPVNSDLQDQKDFYNTFSELAADYAKSWVQKACREESRILQISDSKNTSNQDNQILAQNESDTEYLET